MSAHDPQVATYPKGFCDVRELRCTVCRVVVAEFEVRPFEREAEIQPKMAAAWQRHITPPAEMDFQI